MKTKRLKTVFKNPAECIKKYAEQTQSIGTAKYRPRNGGAALESCFFKDTKIYSYGYHYLLADVSLELNGEKIALVNNYKYSRSTDDQTSIASNALENNGYTVIMTKNPLFKIGIDDITLQKLVHETLAESQKNLQDTPKNALASGKGLNQWEIKYWNTESLNHNETCKKLGLNIYTVDAIQRDLVLRCKYISDLIESARLDRASRVQLGIPELLKGDWYFNRRMQKLTA